MVDTLYASLTKLLRVDIFVQFILRALDPCLPHGAHQVYVHLFVKKILC